MDNRTLNSHQGQHIANEQQMWLRSLDYIQQENIHLKNRLAEMISQDIDPGALEQVEYFQNQFLNKDAIVAILRRDIAAEKELNGQAYGKKNLKRHYRLRQDIEMMEKEFSKLKFEFNEYLLRTL